MKKLQIIEYETNKIIKDIDITGRGPRQIQSLDDGININLDHKRFYTIIKGE